VRAILATTTTTAAKGTLNGAAKMFTIAANDQMMQPGQYDDVILAYRNGAPIRARDVGRSVEVPADITVAAYNALRRCVMLVVYRQPGANIIETVDTIRARLPALRAIIPPSIKIDVILDGTVTIRAAVADVELTLALTVVLVVLVILVFIRNFWVTLIPAVTRPRSDTRFAAGSDFLLTGSQAASASEPCVVTQRSVASGAKHLAPHPVALQNFTEATRGGKCPGVSSIGDNRL